MRALATAAAFLAIGITANAGTIVVSGDNNIGNGIDGSDSSSVVAGNSTFFSNLLGTGTKVLIETTPNGDGSETTSQTSIINFFTGLPGVTVTTTTTATAAQLAGQNLYISLLHDAAYSGTEISAISAFLSAGGTALFTGEYGGFDLAGDNFLNAALTALGSTMQLDEGTYDGGFQNVSGGAIVPGPLTAGITSFQLAATSGVTGGNPVFLTAVGGPAFIETSDTAGAAVPEPSTMILIGGAGMVLAGLRRRRAI
jgi:hypothetical protein